MRWSRPSGKACWDRRPTRPHRRHQRPSPTVCMWFLHDQPTRVVDDARSCRQREQNAASRPRPSPPPSPRLPSHVRHSDRQRHLPRLRDRTCPRRHPCPLLSRSRRAPLLHAKRKPTDPWLAPSRSRGWRSACPVRRYARRARQPGRWRHRSCAWPDPGYTHIRRQRCSRSPLPTSAHRSRATAAREGSAPYREVR